MKKLIGMSMLTFVLVMASAIATAQTKVKLTNEQALIALDKEWTAAELRLNADDQKTISRIVADDYTGTTPFGQIENKAQYIAGLKASSDTDVADEYVVHFFDGGKLVIMSHRGTVNGKPTYRSTHVWVKRGSNWQLLQNHVSNIGAPPIATN
ncbi:MAG TPA: nuclear transport factor 2 family protein [Pyrinomonadaceae bacterium]|nr:nuclear transport factor 2 family protein [Pyrinomonadaceae bacterium]